MRGRACTYNEIAKKMKDGLNVYAKSKAYKETRVVVHSLTTRLRYWLHNRGSAVTPAYNPALVLMATRSRVLPSLLAYLQRCNEPARPELVLTLHEEEDNALTIEHLLRKCYLIPHPATMQALVLLGMQFNTSDKDGLAPYSSFYLGMAHRMGIMLGYHRRSCLSTHSNEQRLRTWRKYSEAVTPAIRLGSVDPSPFKLDSSPELAVECWRLEAAFHQWFRAYSAPPSAAHHLLQPPPLGDYFLASVHVNYFLALHEIAATLRRPSDQVGPGLVGLTIDKPVLTLAAYTRCNPTEKCIALALLGASTLMSSVGLETFIFHGTNFKWWCGGQFMFTLLELTQRYPDHPLVPAAQLYLAFFMTSLSQGQARWSCLADFPTKARTILELFPSP
ncbi:hypothetical protein L0F63_006858 [Massospora cicadina]|nr:hypothetical protein L0F63_006858 [Massospora cicadina]